MVREVAHKVSLPGLASLESCSLCFLMIREKSHYLPDLVITLSVSIAQGKTFLSRKGLVEISQTKKHFKCK
jgi:hypothetical protein